jgi:hypothetical protein
MSDDRERCALCSQNRFTLIDHLDHMDSIARAAPRRIPRSGWPHTPAADAPGFSRRSPAPSKPRDAVSHGRRQTTCTASHPARPKHGSRSACASRSSPSRSGTLAHFLNPLEAGTRADGQRSQGRQRPTRIFGPARRPERRDLVTLRHDGYRPDRDGSGIPPAEDRGSSLATGSRSTMQEEPAAEKTARGRTVSKKEHR